MHYVKHPWDEVLQDFCLLGDNFICDLLRQRQNTLHTIAKARGHLVILVLFFQELIRKALLLPSVIQEARTHLKRDAGNTEDNLCNWVQLIGVNVLLALCGCGIADLCDDSTVFHRPTYRLFHRSAHHRSISLQQSFEFMKRQA